MYGWIAVVLICLKVGAMTKIVRISDMPTSTCEGGLVGVPRALRTNPSTIRMRVKPVTMSSAPGRSASRVIEIRISTGVERAFPLIEMPEDAAARSGQVRPGRADARPASKSTRSRDSPAAWGANRPRASSRGLSPASETESDMAR